MVVKSVVKILENVSGSVKQITDCHVTTCHAVVTSQGDSQMSYFRFKCTYRLVC